MDKRFIADLERKGYAIEPLKGLREAPRLTYYKPDGEAVVLPADRYHMERYLARGFTFVPPTNPVSPMRYDAGTVTEPQGEFTCETCGKTGFKTKLGLIGHSRSHKVEEEK